MDRHKTAKLSKAWSRQGQRLRFLPVQNWAPIFNHAHGIFFSSLQSQFPVLTSVHDLQSNNHTPSKPGLIFLSYTLPLSRFKLQRSSHSFLSSRNNPSSLRCCSPVPWAPRELSTGLAPQCQCLPCTGDQNCTWHPSASVPKCQMYPNKGGKCQWDLNEKVW